MSHAPTVAVPKTPPAQDDLAAPKTSPTRTMRSLPRMDQQRQSAHISAPVKPPPPKPPPPLLPLYYRPPQPRQPLRLAVGEIAWAKMHPPDRPVNGQKDSTPRWGALVQRYLKMHYSHARTQATQYITVQRVAWSMMQVDGIARMD